MIKKAVSFFEKGIGRCNPEYDMAVGHGKTEYKEAVGLGNHANEEKVGLSCMEYNTRIGSGKSECMDAVGLDNVEDEKGIGHGTQDDVKEIGQTRGNYETEDADVTINGGEQGMRETTNEAWVVEMENEELGDHSSTSPKQRARQGERRRKEERWAARNPIKNKL